MLACNNKEEKNKQQSKTVESEALEDPIILTPGNDSIKLPVVIPAGKPVVIAVKNPPTPDLQLSMANAPQGKPHFTTFTTDDGLALDAIACSMMDKNGNLWFGTFGGGVSRYDGKSFTNYSTAQGLANNVVRSITEDKSGNLCFGTYGGGVRRYDGKSFTNYSTA
ncbi:MAG: hypothetical protein IT237_13280, partial [Bacteroidia bacterium]|nr:hypothetical protein [Bacteroidia bacterium]